jgi:hypothetical protein
LKRVFLREQKEWEAEQKGNVKVEEEDDDVNQPAKKKRKTKS